MTKAFDKIMTGLKEVLETEQGHGEKCYYCGCLCNSFHGNPGFWPIPMVHKDDPGRAKWHHIACVSVRLDILEDIRNGAIYNTDYINQEIYKVEEHMSQYE